MKILITENAKEKLRDIFAYHKRAASLTIARKIKNELLERIKTLENFNEIGSLDRHLEYLNLGHRKLIHRNYKIVYRCEDKKIYLTDIFDTRQDPDAQNS